MSNVFRIAKLGKNALTSTSPNDFIFMSERTSPQIIKQDKVQPTHAPNASESFHDFPHALNYTPYVFAFCKFENNRVGIPGEKASNQDFWFTNVRVNATNVRFGYLNLTAGSRVPVWQYIATNYPLAGSPSIPTVHGRRVAISYPGFTALETENPFFYQYHSRWGSFKYFLEGNPTISIPLTSPTSAGVIYSYEQVLATHNLGYYPFFQSSFRYSGDTIYSIMPEVLEDAGFITRHMIYATTTQLIYRFEGGDSFGGFQAGGYDIELFWKIFSWNLGF